MKLLNWIKSLFVSIKKLINKYIPLSVKIVEGIKKVIENGTMDIIGDIIKTIIPNSQVIVDEVEKFLAKRIPELCVELEIINAVNLSDKTEEAVKQALNALKETYGEKWDNFMSGLAGDLARWLADGKLDTNERKENIAKAKKFYDENIRKN